MSVPKNFRSSTPLFFINKNTWVSKNFLVGEHLPFLCETRSWARFSSETENKKKAGPRRLSSRPDKTAACVWPALGIASHRLASLRIAWRHTQGSSRFLRFKIESEPAPRGDASQEGAVVANRESARAGRIVTGAIVVALRRAAASIVGRNTGRQPAEPSNRNVRHCDHKRNAKQCWIGLAIYQSKSGLRPMRGRALRTLDDRCSCLQRPSCQVTGTWQSRSPTCDNRGARCSCSDAPAQRSEVGAQTHRGLNQCEHSPQEQGHGSVQCKFQRRKYTFLPLFWISESLWDSVKIHWISVSHI